MKVRIGGTVEFNIIPASYESVKATATFEIEEDTDNPDDFYREYSQKVQKQLESQLKKHIESSLKKYGEAKRRHQEILNKID